jgi:hypothetical protein
MLNSCARVFNGCPTWLPLESCSVPARLQTRLSYPTAAMMDRPAPPNGASDSHCPHVPTLVSGQWRYAKFPAPSTFVNFFSLIEE